MKKKHKKVILAPAKINLTLEVVGKRSDGYHLLRTVMLKLKKLQDKLTIGIASAEKTEIILRCDQKEIPTDERNTCHKAIKLFLEKIKKTARVEIKLEKKIPSGAGLGGGSSDAASVLQVLNQFFHFLLTDKELSKIASEVGKDVPFFLSKKEGALMEGLGDDLKKEFIITNKFFVLIIKPPEAVSTQMAYGGLAERMWFLNNKNRKDISWQLAKTLTKKVSTAEIVGGLYNDFEISIENQLPIIKELKQSLLVFGAQGALMSGSGSSVFGIFSSEKTLKSAENILRKKYKGFFVGRGR